MKRFYLECLLPLFVIVTADFLVQVISEIYFNFRLIIVLPIAISLLLADRLILKERVDRYREFIGDKNE